MKRRAFTLIEMLVATVIFSLLVAAFLQILYGMAKDSRRMKQLAVAEDNGQVMRMLQWDLANAGNLVPQSASPAAVRLIGHGGIDRASLVPNGRMVQVDYRLDSTGSGSISLWREQTYLDDPVRPDAWREKLCDDVTSFSVFSETTPRIARRVRVNIDFRSEPAIHQELWVK